MRSFLYVHTIHHPRRSFFTHMPYDLSLITVDLLRNATYSSTSRIMDKGVLSFIRYRYSFISYLLVYHHIDLYAIAKIYLQSYRLKAIS